jgi:WD40 repeat protein
VLVSAGNDGALRYTSAQGGKPLAHFGAHAGPITGLVYSPNNNQVYTTGQDGTLRFWFAPPTASRSLTAAFQAPLSALTLSPDGSQVVVAAGKLVRVAALNTGTTMRDLAPAPAAVTSVAATSAANLVAAAADRRALVWQSRNGQLLAQPVAHGGAVTGVAFHPAGTQLATVGKDGMLRLWAMPPVPQRSLPQPYTVRAAVLSPDGKRLASGGADKVVRLYQVNNLEKTERQLSGHTAAVNAITFSPDGKSLASAGDDEAIRFWDLAKGEQSALIGAHTGPVASLVHVGTTLVLSASADGTVKLWQVPAAGARPSFSHAGAVTAAALSPDGSKLLTGCADKQVRLWDLGNGQLERTWSGPALAVQAVAFSPKGDRVAAGSADKSVHVWEAGSPREVKKFVNLPAAVQTVALSADGKHAVAGLADGSVRVFDLAAGKEVNAITGHKGAVNALACTIKGDQALFGGAEGVVHLQGLTAKAPASTWKHGSAISAGAIT